MPATQPLPLSEHNQQLFSCGYTLCVFSLTIHSNPSSCFNGEAPCSVSPSATLKSLLNLLLDVGACRSVSFQRQSAYHLKKPSVDERNRQAATAPQNLQVACSKSYRPFSLPCFLTELETIQQEDMFLSCWYRKRHTGVPFRSFVRLGGILYHSYQSCMFCMQCTPLNHATMAM